MCRNTKLPDGRGVAEPNSSSTEEEERKEVYITVNRDGPQRPAKAPVTTTEAARDTLG